MKNRITTHLVIALVCATAALTQAAIPLVKITGQTPGPTPFISRVTVQMDNPASLDAYTFTIQPKTGSGTRPVSARYSADYLRRRGFLSADSKVITLPVFGLYTKYANTVTMSFRFVNGQTQNNTLEITTAAFHNNTFRHPIVVQPRTPDTTLSYDFILLKNYTDASSPTLIDTDGEMRWVGVTDRGNVASILYDNSVYLGSGSLMIRMEFDGEVTMARDLREVDVADFHHNLDFGRDGILMDVGTSTGVESVVVEINAAGDVLHRWDMGEILSRAMTAGGDDPRQFVQPGPIDWFHNNCAAYRSSDNTLLVSSRENFVIALDYDTQAIKWILGDTTKKWASFPSLRKYALDLGPNTHAPIGQHALSLERDRLLLFDNGYPSYYQVPVGNGRTYSAPRMYKINTAANTATEIWNYKNDKSILSPVCSSVYADQPKNYLIDYATAGPFMFTELIGLDANGSKVFDFKYAVEDSCGNGWNAVPIHLEDMVFN